MIQRLLHISNVGRFVECEPQGLGWSDVTLIYAENGSGKTTLSTVLHSLNNDNPAHILGRHTIGADRPPRVELLLSYNSNIKVTFDDEAKEWISDEADDWTSSSVNFDIFDSNFVYSNVYAGYYVGTDQKKRLYQFVLGEKGVELASHISDLDDESREKSNKIRNLKSDIATHVNGNLSVDEFVALDKEGNVESKLAEAKREVQQQRQKKQIIRRPTLKKVELPQLPIDDLRALLAKSLQHISSEAESQTKAHLNRCCDERGESWISQGLEYAEGENCPFCGTSLAGNNLVEAYRQYFDDAYANLKIKIEKAQKKWENIFPPNGWQQFKNTIDTNNERAGNWEDYLEPDDIFGATSLSDTIREAWKDFEEGVQSILSRKAATPLETISFGNDLNKAISYYKEIAQEVRDYNAKVEAFNEEVQQLRAKAQGNTLEHTENVLRTLQNTQRRHEEEDVSQLCQKYKKEKQAKKDINKDKSQARQKLEVYESDLLEKYEQDINRHLRNYGAHFRIAETKRSNLGGTPHSRYALSLNGEKISLGRAGTPVSERSFRNVLSEGDKNALAFAFFLARLDQEDDLSEKVIVIDDPISSLDAHRMKTTLQSIRSLCSKARQVVVLSHRHQFLYELWREVKKGNCTPALLEISKITNKKSNIGEWKSMNRLVQSPQYQNIRALRNYCDKREGDPQKIARLIRDVLEENLRSRFPDELNMAKSLGDYITNIRKADPNSPLYVLSQEPYYTELNALAEYCIQFKHSSFPSSTNPVNETELSAFAERALDFVRGPIVS